MLKNTLFIIFALFILLSCRQTTKSSSTDDKKEKKEVNVPSFNADSAYIYTADQVNFGPRVPNTTAHVACGDYLSEKLRKFGAEVFEQRMDLINYEGKTLKARNIIGSYQPQNKNRVLLFAHWDTRPFADQDPKSENYQTPIDGANDGAGGCAVLLEIARQINLQQPQIGIDIIFFDAEDWGAPSFDSRHNGDSGYCLGSDYWARNPHINNYNAQYGILLDMVSAPDAKFYKELNSSRFAPNVVQKVWETAYILGYGQYFINMQGGSIEDDHIHVIRHRNIPCIDIIDYDPNTESGFGHYWHTLNDNMDNISKETMQAVGQTILHVLYSE